MQVELNCGDLGYQCVNIFTSDLYGVKREDFLELFKRFNEEEKSKILIELSQKEHIDLENPKKVLSYYLNSLDCDIAKQILAELNQEFLSTKEWQEKLRSINEGEKKE